MAEGPAPTTPIEQARRLERGLVRVRWFAVLLGFYLVSQTNAGSPPRASSLIIHLAYLVVLVLAVGNAGVSVVLDRLRSDAAVRRLGVAAFGLDIAAVFAFTWLYTYDPRGSTWVVIYILPLEAALRYQLRGSLVAVLLSTLNEVGREFFLAHRFPVSGTYAGVFEERYFFLVSNVAFRVGIEAIIALVAGFMARSLAREADKAAQQAQRFEELATREMAARRELAAFNTAVLTGVAAEDLDASMQLMADAIAPDLGFETLTIMLREADELVVKGMHGMPFYGEPVPIGAGVTGAVARAGRPMVVSDVRTFPGYICVDDRMRSEMAVPMRIGDELIGVVDVESGQPDRFTVQDLGLLTRVADQIALVAHSNRLLSQQRETMRRLRELDQMKSDFVAITSHELRTPITAIRGFVKTLLRNRQRLSDQQLANFMQIIDRQSARLARLVEDLLFVSKIEAGTVRMSPQRVHLPALLRETVESLGPESRPRVELLIEEGVGEVTLDPQRVDQILRNLLENGLKFSPPDSNVTLRAAARDGAVEIEVTDRGTGMSAEEIPRIFDRFHQVGEVMTREAEGAGLGLYITKQLVEAMHGTIAVTSEIGRGTTFRISIPPVAAPVDGEAPSGDGLTSADVPSAAATP